jgi:hypothetical protein
MYGYQSQQPYSQSPAYGHGTSRHGGHHQQQHHGPPAGADLQLWQLFSTADTDRSGAITATELQGALVNREFADILLALAGLLNVISSRRLAE